MTNEQPNNPLHGIKLAEIVETLVEYYGFEELAKRININFSNSSNIHFHHHCECDDNVNYAINASTYHLQQKN